MFCYNNTYCATEESMKECVLIHKFINFICYDMGHSAIYVISILIHWPTYVLVSQVLDLFLGIFDLLISNVSVFPLSALVFEI